MSAVPSAIEDYLDELLRRTRADARTTRRLLDEAGEHLHATADELEHAGMSRVDAEAEAVCRFGPVGPIARATTRRSVTALVRDTVGASVFLGAWGLIAVGLSGVVALVMNLALGRSFVGGAASLPGNDGGPSVAEVADDAVVLRVLAGAVGLLALLGWAVWRRRRPTRAVLPAGFVDALGAAAFAAGTVGLVAVAVTRTHPAGTPGAGFALSGAIVALPAAAVFATRSVRALLAS